MTQPKLTREQRAQVIRATYRLTTLEHREFPSSSGNATYLARVMIDGKTMCDCRGWTMKRRGKPRMCKHTRALIDGRPPRVVGDFIYLHPRPNVAAG